MVMAVTYAGGGMLTSGTERDCFAGATCSGIIGFADTPGGTISFVEGATSFVSFACPWVIGVIVSGTVSGAKPCEAVVGEMIVLGFALSLV